MREDVEVAADAGSAADFTLDVARRQAFVEVTASAARPLAVETDPRTPRQPIPAHDGADYLKTIPGFSVIRKGGTDGDPVLRGMAGSRVGILLDGENVLGGCGNRMDPADGLRVPRGLRPHHGPQGAPDGDPRAGELRGRRSLREAERPVRLARGPRLRVAHLRQLRAQRPGRRRPGGRAARATRRPRPPARRPTTTRTAPARPSTPRYERWSANAALGWTPDESDTARALRRAERRGGGLRGPDDGRGPVLARERRACASSASGSPAPSRASRGRSTTTTSTT